MGAVYEGSIREYTQFEALWKETYNDRKFTPFSLSGWDCMHVVIRVMDKFDRLYMNLSDGHFVNVSNATWVA